MWGDRFFWINMELASDDRAKFWQKISKSKIWKLCGATNVLINHSVVPTSTTKLLTGASIEHFFEHEKLFFRRKKIENFDIEKFHVYQIFFSYFLKVSYSDSACCISGGSGDFYDRNKLSKQICGHWHVRRWNFLLILKNDPKSIFGR